MRRHLKPGSRTSASIAVHQGPHHPIRASHGAAFPRCILTFLLLALLLLPAPFTRTADTLASAPHRSFIIDYWDTDDGLPQNSVTAIIQTDDGYLWFGTLNGLVRFDGFRFTVFDESNTPGLDSSRIVALFQDRDTALWIGTETAGIARLQNGVVTSTGITSHGADQRLVAACQDPSGAVWLYTADGVLWRHADDRVTPFLFGAEYRSTTRSLILEPSGPIWIGTDRRHAALSTDPASGLLEPRLEHDIPVARLDLLLAGNHQGYWRLADGRVQQWQGDRLVRDWGPYPWGRDPATTAAEDPDGNLVVGTHGAGLFWFDSDGQITRITTDHGLSYMYILSLLFDREGNLWVGTDGGGLNRIKRPIFQFIQPTRDWVVQAVHEDHQGRLWIGSNGNGVGLWSQPSFEQFGPAQGLIQPYVRSVFVHPDQRVWAGTFGAGLFELQDHRFVSLGGPEVILAIHRDRSGHTWLGTHNGLVRWHPSNPVRFTTANGLSSDIVSAIVEDPDGHLWIGTRGGGLNHLHDDQITLLGNQHGLPGNDISALAFDSRGVLWIGTFGRGLARLDEGRVTPYTTHDGLISNSISYIVDDLHGALWIGSNAGLLRVELESLDAFARGLSTTVTGRAYGKPDGLPTRECTVGAQPWRARDGTLWFPTIKGLASVDPARIQPNPHPPPVMIEAILIDGEPIAPNGPAAPPPAQITLPAAKERIEIHYTSLNLRAPDQARFRYRLEGHETAWTDAGNSRVARYSRLPPGHYRFHVIASNEDGVWNETGRSLAISVLPPLWRTWWFLTVTTLCLLAAIVAIVHYFSTQRLATQLQTLRHQEALERERSRIAADIHDQLGANLTQVALLGELVEADKEIPDEVESHARQIAQTARDTTRALDEIVWAANPSNDTLESLVSYAAKHAQDYLAIAGVRHRFELPETLPHIVLPPDVRHNLFLAFKEAVTNVVRHAQASSVLIRLALLPDAVQLDVQDDGRGIAELDPKAAQARNGLRNMRKRLASISGSCSIEPAPERGTRVRLTVPLPSLGHV